jgi:hypothetical protein
LLFFVVFVCVVFWFVFGFGAVGGGDFVGLVGFLAVLGDDGGGDGEGGFAEVGVGG